MSRRALRRVLLRGLAAVVFVAMLLAALALVYPRAVVETVLARSLGRSVSIGALEIDWGSTIAVRLQALSIASSADLPSEALLSVAAIDARIDGGQLLGGTLAFRGLAIDKAVLALARDSQGLGNWRFSPRAILPAAKGRMQIPDLGAFTLTDSSVRFRTSSGLLLVVALDALRLNAEGSTGPVEIALAGSYQGHKATLAASAGSFDALRDGTRPYAVSLQLAAPQLRLAFDGTLADPLDLDGAVGHLTFAAEHLAALQAFVDADATLAVALQIEGQATRHGDVWRLEAVQGHVAGKGVQAKYLTLLEGSRGASDTATADIAFDELDLDSLFLQTGSDRTSFRPDTATDAFRIDLRIAIGLLRYGKVELLHDVRLNTLGSPGILALREGAASFGGGALTFGGSAQAAGARDSDVRLQARLKGALAERLSALAVGSGDTGPSPPILGLLDAALDLQMSETNIDALLRRSQMGLAVALKSGTIDRKLVEAASTDLRAFFRGSDETMALECLFGVATLKDGVGAIAPVRLHAAEGRFAAEGSFDPVRLAFDILVLSDPTASGSLALDAPLRLQGTAGRMSVIPAPGGRIGPTSLPPIATDFAVGNPCR